MIDAPRSGLDQAIRRAVAGRLMESAVAPRAVAEYLGGLLAESHVGAVELIETWSDAARAASIAARQAKAKGKDWRKAARAAFYKHLSKDEKRAARAGQPQPSGKWGTSEISRRIINKRLDPHTQKVRRAARFKTQSRQHATATARYSAMRDLGLRRSRFGSGWE